MAGATPDLLSPTEERAELRKCSDGGAKALLAFIKLFVYTQKVAASIVIIIEQLTLQVIFLRTKNHLRP